MDFTYEDEFVRQNVPKAAVWEQLAEELGEMQHHALKAARSHRGENPTPCQVHDELIECEKELGDVLNCVRLLELHYDETEMKLKMIRWWKRIKDAQEGS